MNTTVCSNLTLPPAHWLRIALIILFILIVIIGIIGNTLVLLSIISKNMKIRRSPTNLLLVNMSCADLIILIFNLFDIVQFAINHSWPTAWSLGLFSCKFVRFAQVLGCYASVETLLVISIERYVAIIHPMKVSYVNRRKRLFPIFVIIWSFGIVMALPNLYFLTLHPLADRRRDLRGDLIYLCGLSDLWVHSHLITLYKYVESILFFFVPILVQTVLYIIICRNIFLVNRAVQARHQAQQLLQGSVASDSLRQYSGTKFTSFLPSPATDNNLSASPMMSTRSPAHLETTTTNRTGNGSDSARKRAIIMLLLVAALYFIAFSPSQINFIYAQITGSHHLYDNRLFFVISILLALSSTAFNPILFYIFSKFFRENFNKTIESICPSCHAGSKRQNSFPMS